MRTIWPEATRRVESPAGLSSIDTRPSSTSLRASDHDSPEICRLRTAARVSPASLGSTPNVSSERVLEADERRDFVAEPVVVEFEEEVHVDEEVFHDVELEAGGAAQEVVGLVLESHGRKGAHSVESVESALMQPGSVDQV